MGRITTPLSLITQRLDDEPLAVYRQLEHVSPAERTEIVLDLITQYGKLELPERDGIWANLSGIDLSRDTLKTRMNHPWNSSLRWWDNNRQRPNLLKANLSGAHIEDANLEGAILMGAELQGAILWGTNLQNADLRQASLQNADFRWANIAAVSANSANFHRARFQNTRLHDVDLTGCVLTEIYLEFAYFGRTLILAGQLGNGIGEEIDKNYRSAKRGYRALKRNFDELGNYNTASWAYGKERMMEKLEYWTYTRNALKEHRWRIAASNALKVVGDQLVEWVCGYGESVWRVLATLIIVFIVLTMGYGAFGAVIATDGRHLSFPQDWVSLIVFSLGTMTNTTVSSLAIADDPLAHLIASFQVLLTIFLTGLLGFVVGNRIRRS